MERIEAAIIYYPSILLIDFTEIGRAYGLTLKLMIAFKMTISKLIKATMNRYSIKMMKVIFLTILLKFQD